MSWLLGGRKKDPQDQQQQQQQQTQQQQSTQLGFDPAAVSDVSSIFQNQSLDMSRLHPLAGLDKDIEYLDLEEEKLSAMQGTGNGILPSRGWSDDLCYGTGAVYVMGLGAGGLRGISDGISALPKPKVDPSTNQLRPVPFKLQLNTILNNVTKRGPHMGNSAGVLGLSYNIIDAILDNVRGVHDDYNSLAAGAIAGALFKSTKGLKPMGYSAGLMTAAAAAWCAFKRAIN